MKIYTKTGDKGETGLFGGERVSKDNLRIEAYGTIDELNAVTGIAITEVKDEAVKALLQQIQHQLFTLGGDLAAPETEVSRKYNLPRADGSQVNFLEERIDHYNSLLEELRNFILPGGSRGASYLHLARTVCRRAERLCVALNKTVDIGPYIVVYLNRLSDLFFVLSRYENNVSKIPDVIWKK